MSFSDQFKQRVKAIDRALAGPKVSASVTLQPVELPLVSYNDALYSIYKRSVPVETNKAILLNLTMEDVDRLRRLKRLDTKVTNGADGSTAIIYFDVVRQNDVAQKSVYWNPSVFVKEEGSDDNLESSPEYALPETWVN